MKRLCLTLFIMFLFSPVVYGFEVTGSPVLLDLSSYADNDTVDTRADARISAAVAAKTIADNDTVDTRVGLGIDSAITAGTIPDNDTIDTRSNAAISAAAAAGTIADNDTVNTLADARITAAKNAKTIADNDTVDARIDIAVLDNDNIPATVVHDADLTEDNLEAKSGKSFVVVSEIDNEDKLEALANVVIPDNDTIDTRINLKDNLPKFAIVPQPETQPTAGIPITPKLVAGGTIHSITITTNTDVTTTIVIAKMDSDGTDLETINTFTFSGVREITDATLSISTVTTGQMIVFNPDGTDYDWAAITIEWE